MSLAVQLYDFSMPPYLNSILVHCEFVCNPCNARSSAQCSQIARSQSALFRMIPVLARPIGGPPAIPIALPIAQAVQIAPVQPQPDATYRINHKKLHVTLAALGVNELSNDAVLIMARTKGDLLEYSIGDEVHPRPADPLRPRHKHFYLKYANPIQHRDSRYT